MAVFLISSKGSIYYADGNGSASSHYTFHYHVDDKCRTDSTSVYMLTLLLE